jgi:hypothetical protein
MAWLEFEYNKQPVALKRVNEAEIAKHEAFLMQDVAENVANIELKDIRSVDGLRDYLTINQTAKKLSYTRAQLDDMRAELGAIQYEFRLGQLVARKGLARFTHVAADYQIQQAEGAATFYGAGKAKGLVNLAKKINVYVGAAGTALIIEEVLSKLDEIIDGYIAEYIQKKYSEGAYDEKIEGVINKIGFVGAKIFNQRLKEKAGIESPIQNFMAEDLPEQFGVWGATLLNTEINKITKRDLDIFTTILPPSQIKTDLDNFLPIAGELGAAHLNDLFTKTMRQPIAPFTTLYPIETVKEDLTLFAPRAGELIAAEINKAASKLLKKEVHILSTVYPPENIVTEIDLFITGTVNDLLHINLTGVVNNANIRKELQEQVTSLVAHLVSEKMLEAKLKLTSEVTALSLPAAEALAHTQAIAGYTTKILAALDSYKINGLKGTFLSYYSLNRAKISNRARQRKYRTKFKEQRAWVAR